MSANPTPGFEDLQLIPPLLQALREEGYRRPTPIQAQAIPHVLAGRDLLGCAQTGTGKTAAFALPILQRLSATPPPGTAGSAPHGTRASAKRPIRALILSPTRELAAQIDESFAAYGRHTGLRHAVIYGGVSQQPQETALLRGVDVVTATPGRLCDLMEQRLVDLTHLEILVLDEADRMLDMGFLPDVRRIEALCPEHRQTLFFSATLGPQVMRVSHSFVRDPVRIEVAPNATPIDLIEQRLYRVERGDKLDLLLALLRDQAFERAIVFTRTKHGADKVDRRLHQAGIRTLAIHGNKTQGARQRALDDFKSGQIRVLVATDIAARGIDVDNVTHVINFDMPVEPEAYVHRIGRTGRAEAAGVAISFCTPEERDELRAIEKLCRIEIPLIRAEDVLKGQPRSAPPRDRDFDRRGDSAGHRPRDHRREGRPGRHSRHDQPRSHSRDSRESRDSHDSRDSRPARPVHELRRPLRGSERGEIRSSHENRERLDAPPAADSRPAHDSRPHAGHRPHAESQPAPHHELRHEPRHEPGREPRHDPRHAPHREARDEIRHEPRHPRRDEPRRDPHDEPFQRPHPSRPAHADRSDPADRFDRFDREPAPRRHAGPSRDDDPRPPRPAHDPRAPRAPRDDHDAPGHDRPPTRNPRRWR